MMGKEIAAIIFGLAAAASWGAGDFSGGLASRRAHVLGVVVVSHALGLLLLIALALLIGEPLPRYSGLLWGVAAGLAGTVGLVALYRALATGKMGIAAPLTAVLAAAIPVLFAVVVQGLPTTVQMIGFFVALVGVWLLSRPEVPATRPQGLGLAILAGWGFGAFYILIRQAGTSGIFWPLAAARLASFSLTLIIALAGRRPWQPDRSLVPIILLAGILDVAGNTFFVLATLAGRLDVAAILSSLYPAGTIILARLILRERLTRMQAIGIAAALLAVPLIAASRGSQ